MILTMSLDTQMLQNFEKYKANVQWFMLHYVPKEEHRGSFIAVDNGQVIASDPDLDKLRIKVNNQWVFIKYIPQHDYVLMI